MANMLRFNRTCPRCNNIFRPDGKFQKICNECNYSKYTRRDFCCLCGVVCSGKLEIELRKGSTQLFCSYCFNKVRFMPIKEIRKLVNETKDVTTKK